MTFFHSVCAVAAVIAATMAYAQEAATCSSSQISTTETVIADNIDAINGDCDVDPCSDPCVSTMTALTGSLPDCVYTDGVNYYEVMQIALSACDAISGATTSTGDTTGTTTDTTTDTMSTDSTSCSASESADTESYLAEYSDALAANCDPDGCSSDCVTTMTELAVYLPICVYSDGTNYYDMVMSAIASCSETSTGTGDTTTTTTTNGCSSSQLSDTDASLAAINDEYTAACTDDSCSSACLDVMNRLTTQLPDCVYSDGTNYYQRVVEIIAACPSTPTDQETTSGATSTSGTTTSSTSSTTGAASSPATTDEDATAATNACSSSESFDTASYVSAVNTELTASCTDDTCASACLTILTTLSTQLPDCVDTDGVNYYESVAQMIASCSSTSSSSTTTTTSSSTGSSESGENPLYPMLKKPAGSKRKNGAGRVATASISVLAITTTLALASLIV